MTLNEILLVEDVVQSINSNLEYLLRIIPELKSMIGFCHKHPHHHLDVWEHTLYALSLSPNDFEIRLSLLFHDIGKPYCFIEGEIRNFLGHPKVSKEITIDILKRLNYNDDFIKKISYLVEYHDSPITLSKINKNKELEYKRYIIQYCDMYAHHPEQLEKRIKYLNKVKKLF